MKLELTIPPNKLEAPLITKNPTPPRRSILAGPSSFSKPTTFRSSAPLSRRGGGGAGKRGGRGGGGRGGRRSNREPRKTISDLDIELDTFMSQRAATTVRVYLYSYGWHDLTRPPLPPFFLSYVY
ncbi:hypothetical protein HMI55_002265 [Coelomomyces lativittatus]|nr:hypothetical protein HMI55_002265 [Coelomomyces lativittatus]